jgi:hypothetical protein
VPKYDDGKAAVTLGDFPIYPVRVFHDAIPAVAVRHVAGRTAIGNALTVPTVIMGIDAVSCRGERLRKTRVPGAVLRHPVKYLDDRLGGSDHPAAHVEIRAVHRLKRKIRRLHISGSILEMAA